MVSLLLLTGCGKEAAPQPPVIRVAERTTDLTAVQEGTDGVLVWSYPSTTTSGQALTELEAVEVWRATLPGAQEPPPPVSAQDRRLQRQLLEAQGERVAVLDPAALQVATRGPELVFRDDLGQWRQALDPNVAEPVVWYGVRTICCRKRASEMSNVARLLPVEPPPPPSGVELRAGDDGITLQWAPLPKLRTQVERSADGALWAAVTEEPVAGASWRDATATQGRSWLYRVRSVARVEGGGQVFGEPSPPYQIDHPDTYPPPPPEDLVCLPEASRVRLRWATVPGARRYVVSRRLADGTEAVLEPAAASLEFVDEAPPFGELRYLVAATDEVGNTSEPAACTVVMGAVP